MTILIEKTDDNSSLDSLIPTEQTAVVAGHTMGPWTATFSFPGITPGIGDTWQIDCDGHAVCTTQFCYAPNTEANARLIAAAPALLDALKSIRDLGSDGEHSGDRHARCRDIARAAIAQAQQVTHD